MTKSNVILFSEVSGCCRKRNWLIFSFVLAAVFLVLGTVLTFGGAPIIQGVISRTFALSPGSERLVTWLVPPVTPHLTGYAFSVKNPEEVAKGEKPELEEVGPFVYKVVIIKNSRDNLKFNEDGETLTYRPRRFYHYDKEKSGGKDPDKTFITVPNIPLWTAYGALKNDWMKRTAFKLLFEGMGRGTPFINVSFTGLLWGYQDKFPCAAQFLKEPEECQQPEENEKCKDAWGDPEDCDDYDWDYDKRRKRSIEEWPDYEAMFRPKTEYVNCSCYWGLFRDRNVTLRKPVTTYHGMADISMKGKVKMFNNSTYMGWWKENSTCDKLGGQDGGTFPPAVYKPGEVMELFISLMCRKIKMHFEKSVNHSGIDTLRFIPPPNALGSHNDSDPERRNEDNECFCMEEEGFMCFKSGVLDMGPCKKTEDRPKGAPIALSSPHFYQADPSFGKAVTGLHPEKEKHQMYVDVEPQFGIPLAIRPRFQLNAILRGDPDIRLIKDFPKEPLVLPFLWAEDGFSEPSPELANMVKEGLEKSKMAYDLAQFGGIVLVVLSVMLGAMSLSWIVYENHIKPKQSEDIVLSHYSRMKDKNLF